MPATELKRSESDKILGGVCSGLAKTYGWDLTITRIVTAVIVLGTGVGPVLYVLAWLLLPSDSGKVIAQQAAEQGKAWYDDQKAKREQGQQNSGPNDIYRGDDLR
ncbi:PspC domain-containing protein [Granulicoccus phenolivorans]|uniref:PspC domain-containing protein n=1 Tax=Granulicoccus phenolivorans TaxID=266854 RepID=UPI0003FB3E7A|nr:PspC domain-containing protein [Granulicoccus phenolivorans]